MFQMEDAYTFVHSLSNKLFHLLSSTDHRLSPDLLGKINRESKEDPLQIGAVTRIGC